MVKFRSSLRNTIRSKLPLFLQKQISEEIPLLQGKGLLGRFQNLLMENGPLKNMTEVVNFALERNATASYFWAGPQLVVVTLEPEEARALLNVAHPSINRHAAFMAIGAAIGENIFSSSLNKWYPHREVTKQAFSKETVMAEYYSPATQIIQQRLAMLTSGTNNLTEWATQLIMEMTLVTLFGVPVERVQDLKSDMDQIRDLLNHVFHFRKIIVFGLPKIIGKLFFSKDHLNTKKIKKEFHQVVQQLRQKVPEMEQSPNTFWKAAHELLEDDAIIGDLLAFLFAGPDSSISTFLSVVQLLDTAPMVSRELAEEVKNNQFNPAYLHSEKTLLANVIKEALRLYAPFIFLTRGVSSPTPYRDMMLPSGTLVFVPLYHLQRLTSVWGEDALEFKPARWNTVTKEQQTYYMPFGFGAQNCIAKAFALLMIKQLLAQMILNVGLPRIVNNQATVVHRQHHRDVSIEQGGALKPAEPVMAVFHEPIFSDHAVKRQPEIEEAVCD
jgi:cytochrome P450